MEYSKESIEKTFGVEVIALVGTSKFLTVRKEIISTIKKNGHRIIDTTLFYANIDIIDEKPVYTCTRCECYWYDIDSKEITKLC